MKKRHQYLSLLLALTMLLSVFPVNALAAEVEPSEPAAAVEEEATAEATTPDGEEATTPDGEEPAAPVEEETPTAAEPEKAEDLPAEAEEDTQTEETTEGTALYCEPTVNPVYRGLVSADALTFADEATLPAAVSDTSEIVWKDRDGVVKDLQKALENHQPQAVLNYHRVGDYSTNLDWELLDEAFAHTGVPTQGDYLHWQLFGSQTNYYELPPYLAPTRDDGTFYVRITINLSYGTTAEEETQTTAKVKQIVSQLDLKNPTVPDCDKLWRIYFYLIQNVAYDHAHVDDITYFKQYTAYAALCKGTAVCQGYANAFYRLALECGIDNRMIPSTYLGNHIYNIARVGDDYYNLDATWDAGKASLDKCDWFLKSDESFRWGGYSHQRLGSRSEDGAAIYVTEEFYRQYPMSLADFDYNLIGTEHLQPCAHESTQIERAAEATCTEDGYTGDEVCKTCGEVVKAGKVIPAAGHEDENGVCKICGEVLRVEIPTLTKAENIEGGIRLTWKKAAGAASYEIWRKTGSEAWKKLNTTKSTTYVNKGVTSNTTYIYKVRAVNGSKSADSAEKKLLCLSAPEIVSVTNSTKGVTVQWKSVKGAAKYEIWRKTGSGSWSKINTVTGTSYTNPGVTSGNTYSYSVKAINGSSYSGRSASGLTIKCLSAPVIKSITNENGYVRLEWDAVKGAQKYEIYRKDPGATTWKRLNSCTGTIYRNTGITSGKTYSYTVKAISGDYSSGMDDTGKSILCLTRPVVSSVTYQSGTGVTITWAKVPGAAYYEIYRKDGNGSWTKINSTTGTSYVNKGVTKGHTYSYTVRAFNGTTRSACDWTGKSVTVK